LQNQHGFIQKNLYIFIFQRDLTHCYLFLKTVTFTIESSFLNIPLSNINKKVVYLFFNLEGLNNMNKNLLFILTLALSSSAFGHGYITNSRSKLCAQGINHGCGAVRYEPQSVEGPDRFPSTGPADGTIAAAGSPSWGQLNEQTPARWHKVDIKSGANTFKWHFTATHRTRDFRYFITKQGWDQTKPLSRDSFDLTPFCTYSGHGKHPATDISHKCNVPQRSGYQVILGVWDVGDTAASFYSVVDAKISGISTPFPVDTLKDIGDINPSADLKKGDIVSLRLFTSSGELFDQNLEIKIANKAQGKSNTWPKLLAEYINAQDIELEAGIKDTQGDIVPVFGKNDIYTDDSSAFIRAEIEIDLADANTSLKVNLQQNKFSSDQPMLLKLKAKASPKMSITAELFYQGAKIAYQESPISSNSRLELRVKDPQAGSYQLVIKGETADHRTEQKSFVITVSNPVDPTDPGNPTDTTYPNGIGSYTTDMLIQGQNGNTYRCLISGWCNGSQAYYAPGLGLAWKQAWKMVAKGVAPTQNSNITYPTNRGNYKQGHILKGTDEKLYRCKIAGWCNGSHFYYAPGSGLAWGSAWTLLK
jgi:chitin-binding protein